MFPKLDCGSKAYGNYGKFNLTCNLVEFQLCYFE